MKEFWNVGKWMAVILVGAALLFAGCTGPKSSDDSAIPANGGGGSIPSSSYVYKFTVDPQAGKLDIEPVVLGTATQTAVYGGTVDVTTTSSRIITGVTFTGTGLDDMTAQGTPNGTEPFLVQIDQLQDGATPETFKWSVDGGSSWAKELVAITTSDQNLMDNVTIKFAANSGHTLDDNWTLDSTNGCSWTSATNTLNCPVRIMNKSTTNYITNMRTWSYRSTGSEAAALATSDYPNTITGEIWIQPLPVLLNAPNVGMCYLRDGLWNKTADGDQKNQGCPSYLLSSGNQNRQMLHPDCGSLTQTWTFTNDTTPYTFYTALVQESSGSTVGDPTWIPENFGADGRKDYYNLSTFVVQPYNLDYNCTLWGAGNCKDADQLEACISTSNSTNDGWAIGSAYCSTPLDTSAKLATGTYFAVNIGVNFPDRIEGQNHATRQNSTATPDACFDYPSGVNAMITWDPAILDIITSDMTLAAGTHLAHSTDYLLFDGNRVGTDLNAAFYMDTNTGYGAATYDGARSGSGFFKVLRGMDASFTFTGSETSNCKPSVQSDTNLKWGLNSGLPLNQLGWMGLAHFENDGSNNCTIVDGGTKIASDGGPQDQVNYWVAMIYMKVKGDAPSGLGSQLKLESTTDATYVNWANSNCTRNGGTKGTDGDFTSWCYPCTNNGTPITTAPRLTPLDKGLLDSSTDVTNGLVLDLAAGSGVIATNAGVYQLRANLSVHDVMEAEGFNSDQIPDGSTINSVTLRVRCGRNSALLVGIAPDLVQYNIGSGYLNTTTAIKCSNAAAGFKAEQTSTLPITTKAQLAALQIQYSTAGASQTTKYYIAMDYIWVDVNYTAAAGSGPCNSTAQSSVGGVTCNVTSYNPPETDPQFFIMYSRELPNANIAQGGPKMDRGTGYQAQNSHICVQ